MSTVPKTSRSAPQVARAKKDAGLPLAEWGALPPDRQVAAVAELARMRRAINDPQKPARESVAAVRRLLAHQSDVDPAREAERLATRAWRASLSREALAAHTARWRAAQRTPEAKARRAARLARDEGGKRAAQKERVRRHAEERMAARAAERARRFWEAWEARMGRPSVSP